MKRYLRLFTLLTLTSSLNGCALWWWDHDYDPEQHAHWQEHQAKDKSLAAR